MKLIFDALLAGALGAVVIAVIAAMVIVILHFLINSKLIYSWVLIFVLVWLSISIKYWMDFKDFR